MPRGEISPTKSGGCLFQRGFFEKKCCWNVAQWLLGCSKQRFSGGAMLFFRPFWPAPAKKKGPKCKTECAQRRPAQRPKICGFLFCATPHSRKMKGTVPFLPPPQTCRKWRIFEAARRARRCGCGETLREACCEGRKAVESSDSSEMHGLRLAAVKNGVANCDTAMASALGRMATQANALEKRTWRRQAEKWRRGRKFGFFGHAKPLSASDGIVQFMVP